MGGPLDPNLPPPTEEGTPQTPPAYEPPSPPESPFYPFYAPQTTPDQFRPDDDE
jgi:hypothetical protein